MLRRIFRFPRIPFLRRSRIGYGTVRKAGQLMTQQKTEKNSNTEQQKMNVEKGIKKFEKRQTEARGGRPAKFFSLRNIIILIIVVITFIYMHMNAYSTKSLYAAIFIFTGITLYMLLVERFIEKTEIETEIKDMKVEREKEHNVFLDRVQEIEQVKKNRLESIILKDEDGYDRKVWRIGRATSMLLGKKTPRNKVDVDLGESVYSNLVSRAHGVLNLVNDSWYYEDLGSRNGSGLERKRDGRKIKLKSNMPVKVETGDIIYLATTKVLLK